jgi:ArsR family transcriptional regulator
MGVSKTESFSPETVELSAIAKALAHPARIAILTFLRSRSGCICGDIVDALPLSQSTVSQHLKELKSAGLIKGDVDPPRVCYCIDEENWKKAEVLLTGFFKEMNEAKACC